MKKTTIAATVTDATFLDQHGKTVKVKDIVTEKECWYVEKEKRWVLAHKAVQKIAATAGISKNYDVEESPTVQPTYKNELEHIVRVTIHCLAKGRTKKSCVHDSLENTLTVTGEANKLNTPVRGRGYLRKMAEKRAYDIAVLEHLALYDTTFSEEESETMTGSSVSNAQTVEISNRDIELLQPEINTLLACDTLKKLSAAVEEIKAKRTNYSPAQLQFLEQLQKDRLSIVHDINSEDSVF